MHRRNWKKRAMGICFVFILCMGIFTGCEKAVAEVNEDQLKVTLFRVGKADAIVLETGGRALIIDGGEEEDGEEVVAYLKQQHISEVDALIITHYDHDHVGGADTVVETLNVKEVFVPAYEGSNVEYVDFMRALEKKKIQPKPLTSAVTFSFGNAQVEVDPPSTYQVDYEKAEMDNNFSLITTVTHGKNKLLFMGDAEKWRIRDWLDQERTPQCDFLKVPHHGVYNKALGELVEAVQPKEAVICSSNKNPADPQTLELLKETNMQVFQTKDGNVTVLSDGIKLEMDQQLEEE